MSLLPITWFPEYNSAGKRFNYHVEVTALVNYPPTIQYKVA